MNLKSTNNPEINKYELEVEVTPRSSTTLSTLSTSGRARR